MSLHTRSFMHIHFSYFRYRWTKTGFTGLKTFQDFREMGPWKQKKRKKNKHFTQTKSNIPRMALYSWLLLMLNHDSSGSGLIFACVKWIKSRLLSEKNSQTLSLVWTLREAHTTRHCSFCKINLSLLTLFFNASIEKRYGLKKLQIENTQLGLVRSM